MARVSEMAKDLQGSMILQLVEQIRQKVSAGANIHNLTIGDFDPNLFPIPDAFRQEIKANYDRHETNYPASNGMPELRKAVAQFISDRQGLDYDPDCFLIASGSRPLIYSTSVTLVDPGDTSIYQLPSWNNNHYAHMSRSRKVEITTEPEAFFMTSAGLLAPHIADARLVAMCSPLNPTGTAFSEEQLAGICETILTENKRRGPNGKPVYLLYDQIYWLLSYGDTQHYDPVNLFPEMRDYTIFIDGMSKAFASTGVRVGWGFGPKDIIAKMKSILGHVGAWAPRAEQLAAAAFLQNTAEVDAYLAGMKSGISARLHAFYDGFKALNQKGLPVDAIAPQAALYLSVKMDLLGLKTPEGKVLKTGLDMYAYLLDTAGVALVPFAAFGLPLESPWFRLSIGTCTENQIPEIMDRLADALALLKPADVQVG